jgi:hypothetical protein
MITFFHVVPTCCSAVISPSSSNCHQNFFWKNTAKNFIATCFIYSIHLISWAYSNKIPFFVLCFKEILVSVPVRWQQNSAETCRSYVKYCKRKLSNIAFVCATGAFYEVVHCPGSALLYMCERKKIVPNTGNVCIIRRRNG